MNVCAVPTPFYSSQRRNAFLLSDQSSILVLEYRNVGVGRTVSAGAKQGKQWNATQSWRDSKWGDAARVMKIFMFWCHHDRGNCAVPRSLEFDLFLCWTEFYICLTLQELSFATRPVLKERQEERVFKNKLISGRSDSSLSSKARIPTVPFQPTDRDSRLLSGGKETTVRWFTR